MNCKFQKTSGLYLAYFDFFFKSVSQLDFKKSPIQVHVITNYNQVESFKTNLACIWVILIFEVLNDQNLLQNRIWLIGFRVMPSVVQVVISQNQLKLLGSVEK